MEGKVKEKISECIICADVSKSPTPQPLEPSILTKRLNSYLSYVK